MGDAIAVLLALDEAAGKGLAPSTVELAALKHRWMEPQLEDLLSGLKAARWVHITGDGGWALARRLSDSTLADLYAGREFDLPRESDPDWPSDTHLAGVLDKANGGIAAALDIPLAEFRLRRASAVAMREHAQGADQADS